MSVAHHDKSKYLRSSAFIRRAAPGYLLPALLLLLLLTSACRPTDITPSAFDPAGPAAQRIEGLWWLLLGFGTVVYLAVMGIMLFAIFRRRGDETNAGRWQRLGRPMIIAGGIVIPLIILSITYGMTLSTLSALNPARIPDDLIIEVTGRQWWWEIRYPQYDVVTANEIHVPVGRPVKLHLLSHDVIHSFWVPELHGKKDLIPGRMNEFWLQADRAGEFRGACAEYCGIQHARMLILVIAQPEAELADWLEQQQEPAAELAEEAAQEGYEIFFDAQCDLCHTIAGTPAAGTLGPDLTHIASRRTLGAGIMPNTRGYLAGWIADPHSLKPGNLMPTSQLAGPELQALLAYLESLE